MYSNTDLSEPPGTGPGGDFFLSLASGDFHYRRGYVSYIRESDFHFLNIGVGPVNSLSGNVTEGADLIRIGGTFF